MGWKYDDDWIRANYDTIKISDLCDVYNSLHGTDFRKKTFNLHCNRIGLKSISHPNHYEYDDMWIRNNYDGTNNAELCRKYNKAHNTTIERQTFNHHCKSIGLYSKGNWYSEEQKRWLISNYPVYGAKKTTVMFNKKFGTNKSNDAIKGYCRRFLNIQAPFEIRYKDRTSKVGTISTNCRGDVKIKTKDGWIPANHSVVDVPKDCCTINLDKNKYNLNPDNIAVVSRRVASTFHNMQMYSEDRDITLAGILWAELCVTLLDNGVSKEKIYE